MQDKGVIPYASRKLKPHEELYATHDLELITVVLALKIWRHYLVGRSFMLKSDHQSLNICLLKETWMLGKDDGVNS